MSFWVAVLLSIVAAIAVMLALYRVYMPVKVVAPNKDIPAGAVIGQADIGYVTLARRDMHQLALTDPGQVIGKYAGVNLYNLEPILSQKIIADPSGETKNSVSQDETWLTLNKNEARWPQNIRAGETMTAVAILEGGNPQVVGKRIKILTVTDTNINLSGTVDQIKNAVSANSGNSITLALKWDQVGPLLFGKARSKELWLLPEAAGADLLSGDIYNPGQLDNLLQQLNYGKDKQPAKTR